MRILVLNHIHPDAKHVSGLRMSKFAEKLSEIGEQVLLITTTSKATITGTDINTLNHSLATHNWKIPFQLSCPPIPAVLAGMARTGKLPPGVRHIVLGIFYLWRGGVFPDWSRAVEQVIPELEKSFQPDVVYATFGNTDTFAIAQLISKKFNCPWVADFKDNWSAFIPFGFRRLLANRFSDFRSMTLFSETHKRETEKWFSGKFDVIYSGYDSANLLEVKPLPDQSLTILISGSVYSEKNFKLLLTGIGKWVAAFEHRTENRIKLFYAGNEGNNVQKMVNASLADPSLFENLGFLPMGELQRLQRQVGVNAYICNSASLLHQKFIELCAAQRPIIVVPNESKEAISIANLLNTQLYNCPQPEIVCESLGKILNSGRPAIRQDILTNYSWKVQTEKLREVFQRATVIQK
tara:strand:- start:1576 stop:2799 length:1224 start_codon:yes stop_codon:yes gene_type:complete